MTIIRPFSRVRCSTQLWPEAGADIVMESALMDPGRENYEYRPLTDAKGNSDKKKGQ
jgi:hypothetical protein